MTHLRAAIMLESLTVRLRVKEASSLRYLIRNSSGSLVRFYNKILFVELIAAQKKSIPSMGQYDLSKTFDKISRPKGYK